MRTLIWMSAMGALTLPTNAFAQSGTATRPEPAQHELVGLWRMTPIAPLGTTGEARTIRMRPDWTYTTYTENSTELWSGTFSIDTTTTPRIWDHRSFRMLEADPTSDILGAYKIEGDVVRVSVTPGRWDGDNWMGLPRARQLQTAEGYAVIEFRRISNPGG